MGLQQPPTMMGVTGVTSGSLGSSRNQSTVNALNRSTSPVAADTALALRAPAGGLQSPADAIDAMLSLEMTAEQHLRMIIALLILQMLLGKDTDDSTSSANELAKLAIGLDALGGRNQPVIFTSTHIVQMQYQSTLVYSDLGELQPHQPTDSNPWVSGGGGQDDPGSRLDVTA